MTHFNSSALIPAEAGGFLWIWSQSNSVSVRTQWVSNTVSFRTARVKQCIPGEKKKRWILPNCNFKIQEAEVEGLQRVRDQLGIQSKTVLKLQKATASAALLSLSSWARLHTALGTTDNPDENPTVGRWALRVMPPSLRVKQTKGKGWIHGTDLGRQKSPQSLSAASPSRAPHDSLLLLQSTWDFGRGHLLV